MDQMDYFFGFIKEWAGDPEGFWLRAELMNHLKTSSSACASKNCFVVIFQTTQSIINQI